MIEVGIVTTLSMWVWLFSPSPVSRWIAAAVFAFNVFYVAVERERPAREPMLGRAVEPRHHGQAPAAGADPAPDAATPAPDQGAAGHPAQGDGQRPPQLPSRII
jgi:hypothetical protein